MSRRRQRRRRGGNTNTNNTHNNHQQHDQDRKTDGRPDGVGFWGDPSALPDPVTEVRITEDAHAVPRSLGEPPLPGHKAIAEHYFAAVYDRAVSVAGALAAVGGMIDPGELDDE